MTSVENQIPGGQDGRSLRGLEISNSTPWPTGKAMLVPENTAEEILLWGLSGRNHSSSEKHPGSKALSTS